MQNFSKICEIARIKGKLQTRRKKRSFDGCAKNLKNICARKLKNINCKIFLKSSILSNVEIKLTKLTKGDLVWSLF